MIQVDLTYYGKIVIAPVNIVLYNIFSSHGPNLYGEEPFSYYILNGILNFNIGFLLAIAALPISVIIYKFCFDIAC